MCSVDWQLRLQAESRKPSLTLSRLHHVGVSAGIHFTDQNQIMTCEENGRKRAQSTTQRRDLGQGGGRTWSECDSKTGVAARETRLLLCFSRIRKALETRLLLCFSGTHRALTDHHIFAPNKVPESRGEKGTNSHCTRKMGLPVVAGICWVFIGATDWKQC